MSARAYGSVLLQRPCAALVVPPQPCQVRRLPELPELSWALYCIEVSTLATQCPRYRCLMRCHMHSSDQARLHRWASPFSPPPSSRGNDDLYLLGLLHGVIFINLAISYHRSNTVGSPQGVTFPQPRLTHASWGTRRTHRTTLSLGGTGREPRYNHGGTGTKPKSTCLSAGVMQTRRISCYVGAANARTVLDSNHSSTSAKS